MDNSQFESLADATLARLQTAIEDADCDDLDAEVVNGILTIELESGARYLLNRHGPNRELWLSSPVSGAWHFAWNPGEGAWISTRGSDRLEILLGRELSEATGKAIDFASQD
jgi:iron-sulfur cluster assembly protein CyaY